MHTSYKASFFGRLVAPKPCILVRAQDWDASKLIWWNMWLWWWFYENLQCWVNFTLWERNACVTERNIEVVQQGYSFRRQQFMIKKEIQWHFYDCYRMWNMAYGAKVKHFYVVLYFLYSKNKNPSISCKILQLRMLYTNPRRNSIVSSYVEVPWLKKGRTAIVGWRLIFVFQVH